MDVLPCQIETEQSHFAKHRKLLFKPQTDVMPQELINSILKSESSHESLSELRSLLSSHLEVDDESGTVELSGESIRLIATGELVLEDGKQQVTLDAIAYAFNTCTRLERQMSALIQILIEKETAPNLLIRLRAISREVEEERDR